MKPCSLSLLFLFCSTFIFGQIPFAPLGAKYYTKQACPPYGGPPPYLWEINTDSTIQGKYCTKIASSLSNGCSDGTYFVHYDNEQVYVYDEDLEAFHLLYDFSLTAGSSYRIKACEAFTGTDSVTVFVEEVNSTMYGTEPAKIQQLKVVSDNDSTGFIWKEFNATIYEGIGGLNGNRLLFPDWIYITTDCFTEDLCYWSDLTGPVALLGDSQPCIFTPTKEANLFDFVQLSPNPTMGPTRLRYDFPQVIKGLEFRIYNSTGQSIRRLPVQELSGELQIDQLPAGLYLISLFSSDSLLGTERLLVTQ